MELTRRESAAYAAALMDGEGVFNITRHSPSERGRKSPSFSARVIVGMTDKGGVNFLYESYGGKVVRRDPPSGQARGRQPMFYWRLIEKKRLVLFLNEISPFLRVKAAQAKLMLKFLKQCQPVTPRKGQKGTPRMTEAQIAKRELYYHKMKILNGNLLQ